MLRLFSLGLLSGLLLGSLSGPWGYSRGLEFGAAGIFTAVVSAVKSLSNRCSQGGPDVEAGDGIELQLASDSLLSANRLWAGHLFANQ